MKNYADTQICRRCTRSFSSRSNRTAYCEACCTHICLWCGQQFYRRIRYNDAPRFCSNTCVNLWQQSPQGRRDHHDQERMTGTVVSCVTCGKSVYKIKARMHAVQHYCSRKCRRLAVTLVCSICGTVFTRPPSDIKLATTNYCSPACNGVGTIQRAANGELFQPSRLEIAGRTLLKDLGIQFQEQQMIGKRFLVDVVIPSAQIVIQWDGDFWHGNPSKFPRLTAVQQTNVQRDSKCNTYLKKCGYTVLRFWETDVYTRPSCVAAEILAALANSSKI